MVQTTATSFDDVYKRHRGEIEATARNQRIPGMTTDEVCSEMIEVLWKACSNYDPDQGTPLMAYWWSCWMYHKSNLLDRAFARKRQMIVLTDDGEVRDADAHQFSDFTALLELGCPTTAPIDRQVWNLLATGSGVREVMATLGINSKRFYKIIGQWKTTEVFASLAIA